MASVSTDKNGNRRIVYTDGEKRRAIHIGNVQKKTANDIKLRVERLLEAKHSHGPIEPETVKWISSISDDLAEKLATAGLIHRRSSATLGGFIGEFMEKRSDAKERTRTNLKQATAKMLTFFGSDISVKDVTAGRVEDWLRELRKSYAPAYVARLTKYGKQIFHTARRAALIERSPFDEIKAGTMANPDRMHFVTSADTEAILSACPTSEWRLIVALARYGGLRCPSELLALQWGDIDWERGRFLVRSPKTAHHADGGRRWVPLFPELRPHLETAFDEAPEGQTYVVNRARSHETNLRTSFERIVYKAGLLPWPKPFQNMRASRETELMKKHPMHVVTSWIGNTAAIAAMHYLQVTDADFEKATADARPTRIPTRAGTELNDRSGPESEISREIRYGPFEEFAGTEKGYAPQESNL